MIEIMYRKNDQIFKQLRHPDCSETIRENRYLELTIAEGTDRETYLA